MLPKLMLGRGRKKPLVEPSGVALTHQQVDVTITVQINESQGTTFAFENELGLQDVKQSDLVRFKSNLD